LFERHHHALLEVLSIIVNVLAPGKLINSPERGYGISIGVGGNMGGNNYHQSVKTKFTYFFADKLWRILKNTKFDAMIISRMTTLGKCSNSPTTTTIIAGTEAIKESTTPKNSI
jgi:hypothetical protein